MADFKRMIGDAGNGVLFTSTTAATVMMLYRLPSESYFDKGWLNHGFCVQNSENTWTNSHALSFYVDTLLTVANFGMYYRFRHQLSELGKALAFGSIPATLGHGLGHLHYGLDPGGTDLRINMDMPMESLTNTLVMTFAYASIFFGTMPLASKTRIFATAMFFCTLHNVLSIPPTLTFVYAQAAIYLASSLHMLSLDTRHKESVTYMAYALLQLPVLCIGVLESTRCENFLKELGGHAVYDGAIGVGVIILILLSAKFDHNKID